MLGAGNVLITTEEGVIEAILPAAEAGDNIQYHPGIISPGFINCHCHLELSHMKGVIPEKTGLVDFVITVMQQRGFPEEVILDAITAAEADMLQNGIVAVGDICNTTNTGPQKQKGNLHYYNFIEATGFIPQFAEKRFQQSEGVYEQFSEMSIVKREKIKERETGEVRGETKEQENNASQLLTLHSKLLTSIVPHAPYSTSLALMQLINQHSAGKVITIHNQETKEEESFFITGESGFRKLFALFNIDTSFFQPSGKSSLQTYLPSLDKAANLLLVHNTFTNEDDILFAKNLSSVNAHLLTFFCLCPNANRYIENTLPPVDLLRKHNCNIVLGTDSLASNHALSILDELRTLHLNFPHVPTEELLRWATLNGAKALQMDGVLGSLEKGKQPGVICIEADLGGVTRLI